MTALVLTLTQPFLHHANTIFETPLDFFGVNDGLLCESQTNRYIRSGFVGKTSICHSPKPDDQADGDGLFGFHDHSTNE